MGGVMILLFGMITVIGINTLVRAGKDLATPRSLGDHCRYSGVRYRGMKFSAGAFAIEKIGLAGILGLFLNLVLPRKKCSTGSCRKIHRN